LQKEHPLLLANFTQLANALTINPLLNQLPTTMTYQLGYHYIWNNETRSRIILSKLVKQTMGAM